MSAFFYKAMDSTGALLQGEIEARSREDAYRQLLAKQLRPTQIAVGAAASVPVLPGTRPARLKAVHLLQLTEELADLLESGLQLEKALSVIESREQVSPVSSVAAFLRQQIREGKSFSSALRSCQESFSELYVSMVAAGEAAGALESILRRQAQYISIVIDLKKRVSMALIYPCIVFVTGVVLLCIFMLFLLPQLTALLSRTGRELPLVTRILISVSEFFGHYWWVMLLGLILSGVAFRSAINTPAGRRLWDRYQLTLPLVGPILTQQFFAQFLQALATLLSNGVGLLSALGLMANATPNTYIRKILQEISLQVAEGVSFSRCMKKSGFFPSLLLDIVGVGEQTGKIAPALQRGAVRYEKEFNARIQKVTLLITPVTILLVALFVGLIAYSMITGILTSVSTLRMR